MPPKVRRLGELDIIDRFAPHSPVFLTQVIFGAICTAAGVGARLILDYAVHTAGPYSLIYPAILISTLFGRWQSGLITWATSYLYAWYFVLPAYQSFSFTDPTDFPRTMLNGAVTLIIVAFAELFRRAVRRAVAERDTEIEQRDLLLSEIDHRMKNNFAIVASLLNLQKSQHTNEEIRSALTVAAARVHSFAAAHQFLYYKDGDAHKVDMRAYFTNLSKHLSEAHFMAGDVDFTVEAEPILMPRDQAVALGLVVNELVTNAAKHAFDGGADKRVKIEFGSIDSGWRLCVIDNGRGISPSYQGKGLGQSLVEGFAEKAGGEIVIENRDTGTCIAIIGSGESERTPMHQ